MQNVLLIFHLSTCHRQQKSGISSDTANNCWHRLYCLSGQQTTRRNLLQAEFRQLVLDFRLYLDILAELVYSFY